MIGITGKRSSITKAFVSRLNEREVVYGTTEDLPRDLDAYLLCAGVLVGKSARDISDEEAKNTFQVNFINVIRFCDDVFSVNKRARVCIIGSESGYLGSYDMVYAGSKAAMHLYIQSKHLEHATQHLVGISPVIIEDSGMTEKRSDFKKVQERGEKRRMGRWLRAEEVARVAHVALGEDALCNTVIRMTGGNW
jgi:NAD(P)-dependent dehydrogenase (short-subunit alcohol dehydrogenase family)